MTEAEPPPSIPPRPATDRIAVVVNGNAKSVTAEVIETLDQILDSGDLFVSRRVEEKVVLPTVDAVIKILAAHNGQARLGVSAPAQLPILRAELTGSTTGAAAAGEGVAGHLDTLRLVINRLRQLLEMSDPAVCAALHRLEAGCLDLTRQVEKTEATAAAPGYLVGSGAGI